MKKDENKNKEEVIVLFRSYPDMTEASRVMGFLKEAGIPCFLSDDYMQSLYPVSCGGIGGVKLNLFARDLSRAEELLQQLS